MGVPVQAKTIRAADPGLGFTLQFDSPPNSTVRVVARIANSYTSEVHVLNPINDTTLVCVVPFGDSSYTPGQAITFELDIYVPHDANDASTISGIAMQDSGVFQFASNIPTRIEDGQTLASGAMINSLDGQYAGIMQGDGNFCVYAQAVLNGSSSLPNTDSTYSQGHAGAVLKVQRGRIYIQDVNGNTVTSSPQMSDIITAAMVIDSNGNICLLPPGSDTPVPVSVR
ncbi:MAG: hypothetical protein SF053_05810 [Bacteroidia bacterium]|nr:hypothetical protein [Bacteroidia bacterium]